jgi:hypothetical protein
MPYARKEMEQDLVLVHLITLEILTSVVDLNAYKTMIVQTQKPVLVISAKTHVLEHVVEMLSVKFSIISLLALVCLVTPEIQLMPVTFQIENHHHHQETHANLRHAVLTVFAAQLTATQCVHVNKTILEHRLLAVQNV